MFKISRNKKQYYIAALVTIIIGFSLIAGFYINEQIQYEEIDIQDIEKNPLSYDKNRVIVKGILVKNIDSFFGEVYHLYAANTSSGLIDENIHVALQVRDPSSHFDQNYVSYVFDGREFNKTASKMVEIRGVVHYFGETVDAAPYYIEIDSIELVK